MRLLSRPVENELMDLFQHLCYIILLLSIHPNGLVTQEAHFNQSSILDIADMCTVYNSNVTNCSGMEPPLTAVPSNIDKRVNIIILSFNHILTIEEDDFLGLEFIVEIHLDVNNISSIHPNAFKNLYRLESLNLYRNRLTELDPSGTTFQHLPSLQTLNLSNNNISKVNKYSFFTTGGRYSVTIDLSENPIECDCDFKSLLNWSKSSSRIVTIVPNFCQSFCNSTQSTLFSENSKCFICVNERTNYGCKEQREAVCPNSQMVCQKTLHWDDSTQSMSISSTCGSEQTCLTQEVSNRETCGLGYQSNGNITCTFCCRGPTCMNSSVGGRTQDFTYFLKFLIPAYSGQMEALQNLLTYPFPIPNITAGVKVYQQRTRLQQNNNYEVVLRLEVTTFNTENITSFENSVHNMSNQALMKFIKNDSLELSTYVEDYGWRCSKSSNNCSVIKVCATDQNATDRCLCDSSSFYSFQAKNCLPTAGLRVKFLETATTSNTVTFLWIADKFGTNVSYTILQPTPNEGHLVPGSLTASGGAWTGLRSGTLYNFTVIATLPADNFVAEKNVASIIAVFTTAGHGDNCSLQASGNCSVCSGQNMECTSVSPRGNLCLCSANYYFNYANESCRNMAELQVKNIAVSSSTTDTVTLKWTADKHGINVIYSLQPTPLEGIILGSASVNGATWTGLSPDTEYTFSVNSSFLPIFSYYATNYIIASIHGVRTKKGKTFTVFLSYIRWKATSKSVPTVPDIETERIIFGIKSDLKSSIKVMDVTVFQYKEYIQMSLSVAASFNDTDLSVQEKIINFILSNFENQDGFFFKEQLKSLNISSNLTGSYLCPYSITASSEKGAIKWIVSEPGSHFVLCPYQLQQQLSFAHRICFRTADGISHWAEVNDSSCATEKELYDSYKKMLFENVTAENAKNISFAAKELTKKFENTDAGLVNSVVNTLEQMKNETILEQPGIVTNVLETMSNLIKVDVKTLQTSEAGNSSCRRLLDVISYLTDYAPLTDGKMVHITSNIALAAQAVEANETRDLVLSVDTEPNQGLSDDMNLNLNFSTMLNPYLTSTTNIVIPTQAVIDSLTPDEKSKLSRISFVVHESDKLFAAIQTTTISDGEKESDNYTTKINSRVIAASVPGAIVQSLSKNITMSFEYNNTNATNPRCKFWSESFNDVGSWSGEGCSVVQSNEGHSTCVCNHLTNFALLMDVYQESARLSERDRIILEFISYVGCGISLMCLLITLITYSLVRKLRRDNPSKILINLSLALLLSNLVFLVGMQDYTFDNTAGCKAVAVLLHYFLLASLFWMLVEAFYMYLALVVVFKTYFTNFILKCSIVGWGVPLVIVIITVAIDATDNYGFVNNSLCWLKNPAFYGAFVAPVCLILLINFITFGFVIRLLLSSSSQKLNKTERFGIIQRLRGAVGVVILLGLTWIFAIFAVGQASVVFYYLFAVFNSLQGLFIFIFYCLLKSDAIATWKSFLPCFAGVEDSSNTYSHFRGAAANSTGQHLAERSNLFHSRSSKSSGNTKSTNSTLLDSRKDSCFSTLSSSNLCDNINETDTDTGGDTDVNTSSTLLQPPQHSQNVKPGLTSITPTEHSSSAKIIDRPVQDSHLDTLYESSLEDQNLSIRKSQNLSIPENQNLSIPESQNLSIPESQNLSIPESQNLSIPENSPEPSGTLCDIQVLPANTQPPKPSQQTLNLSQTANNSSTSESEFPDSPSGSAMQPSTPPYSPKNDDELNIAFDPFHVDGEIDYNQLASVHDTIRQFELSVSDASDRGHSET